MLMKCPVCGGELEIRELACTRCSTRIIGKFKRTPFEYLSEEQIEFLLEFLKSWGNFSEVARRLKLSYPTVRSRYAEILRALGLEEELSISEILDMVERGEISAEEAEKLILERKKR